MRLLAHICAWLPAAQILAVLIVGALLTPWWLIVVAIAIIAMIYGINCASEWGRDYLERNDP